MVNLGIHDIVQINLSMLETAQGVATLNSALILGSSGRLPEGTHLKTYSSAADMLEDGFTASDPEYLAAVLYFGQPVTPGTLCVGQLAADEDVAEALQACAEASDEWFALYICDATSDQLKAVATWIKGRYNLCFYNTAEVGAYDEKSSDDIIASMKSSGASNMVGMYSTAQYAAAALMGLVLGMNDGSDDSAFTAAYKPLAGVAADKLNSEQVNAIKDKNGNVYILRSSRYSTVEQGVCSDGSPIDEVLGLMELSRDIQIAIMDILVSIKQRKVAYTDEDTLVFVSAISKVCDDFRNRGFITPGVWTGPSVLNLENGDAMTGGYSVQVERVADQPVANRAARVAPPMHVCINLAGAIEHCAINLFVQH